MSRNPLTENEKAQMVEAYRGDASSAEIAKRFNHYERTVQRIVKNSVDPKELEELKKQKQRKRSSAKSSRRDEEKSHPASAQIPGKEYMQSSYTSSNDKEKGACLKLRENLRKCLQEFGSEAQGKRQDCLSKERQTARLLIEPYLKILGIKTLDPKQLQPEYPIKNGKSTDHVDYAILHEDKPIWLIEVKHAGDNLPDQLPAQLNGYAVNTRAPFASLTNGIVWHWYIWDDNDKRKLEETPFLKNDVCHLTSPQLDWLTAVQRGLHKPDAENKAKACKMVVFFGEWIRRLAEKPSREILKLVLHECSFPEKPALVELASEAFPKAWEYFIRSGSQSDARERQHPPASIEGTITMSEAVGETRRPRPSHKDESEGLVESGDSRMARYRFNQDQGWIEVPNATHLMLDVVKWCSEEHIRGVVDYYNRLSRVQLENRSLPILSKDWNKSYSRKTVDGWHIFNCINNQGKSGIINEILAACIKRDGTRPIRNRDLWVEIPNAC